MRYRELLRLYEKKALSAQEMEQVAKDIERQDAISEYLYERDGALPFEENEGAAAGTGNSLGADAGADRFAAKKMEKQQNEALKFTREVNRLIRRAFVKMGVTVGCIVLAAVMFVMFAMPKIVSMFYYNPAKMVDENTPAFCRDLRVYTELTMPGYIRENVSIQDRGYGNYDIMIYQNISYNRKMTNIAGTVEKGKLRLYDMNLLRRPTGNVFAWFQMTGDSEDSLRELTADGAAVYSVGGNREMATEILQNLNDSTIYLAYITLDRITPYEEFMEFVEKSEYPISWCAVCTENGISTVDIQSEKAETGTDAAKNRTGTAETGSDRAEVECKIAEPYFRAENLGFQCNPDHSNMLNWDGETYPHLILWDENEEGKEERDKLDEYTKNESYMQEHFVSMLRYMAEQEQFLELMEGQSSAALMADRFLSAADYVEQNGLMVYGCVAIADKETILQMNEDAAVYEIYAEELQ